MRGHRTAVCVLATLAALHLLCAAATKHVVVMHGRNAKVVSTSGSRTVPMTAADGRRYTCSIPNNDPSNGLLGGETLDGADGLDDEVVDERDLLSELSNKCIYMISGWWTYELCHNKHIRQYHQEPNSEKISAEFYLGKYNKDVSHEKTEQEREERAALIAAAEESGESVPDREAFSEHYDRGTECDLTKEPRTAEVKYECSPSAGTQLVAVKEPSTCHYTISVQTALLCTHPDFAPTEEPVSTINCVPEGEPREWPTADGAAAEEATLPKLKEGLARALGVLERAAASDGLPSMGVEIVYRDTERGELVEVSRTDESASVDAPAKMETLSDVLEQLSGSGLSVQDIASGDGSTLIINNAVVRNEDGTIVIEKLDSRDTTTVTQSSSSSSSTSSSSSSSSSSVSESTSKSSSTTAKKKLYGVDGELMGKFTRAVESLTRAKAGKPQKDTVKVGMLSDKPPQVITKAPSKGGVNVQSKKGVSSTRHSTQQQQQQHTTTASKSKLSTKSKKGKGVPASAQPRAA